MRLLLVEDEPRLAEQLTATLTRHAYAVDHSADGESADFLGSTEPYAAAILDLGLPGIDGLTVLRRWRRNGAEFPVVVLTARGDWSEKSRPSTPVRTTTWSSPSTSKSCSRACAP